MDLRIKKCIIDYMFIIRVNYKTPFIMGNEFAGVIEKVGDNVSKFKVGDRVYARMPLDKIGTFAEYLTVDEKEICIIPEYLSFEEATAVPLTALTAIQAYKLMNVKSGIRYLKM